MILNEWLTNASIYMISELATWRLSIFPTKGSRVQSLAFQRPAVPSTSSDTHYTTNCEAGPLARLHRMAQQDDGDGNQTAWRAPTCCDPFLRPPSPVSSQRCASQALNPAPSIPSRCLSTCNALG